MFHVAVKRRFAAAGDADGGGSGAGIESRLGAMTVAIPSCNMRPTTSRAIRSVRNHASRRKGRIATEFVPYQKG